LPLPLPLPCVAVALPLPLQLPRVADALPLSYAAWLRILPLCGYESCRCRCRCRALPLRCRCRTLLAAADRMAVSAFFLLMRSHSSGWFGQE